MVKILTMLLTLAAASVSLGADIGPVVERAREAFDVPGIAVAIVKDGQVVQAKGYGLRKLGAPERVTENTLFGIASNTKAFTAAALAMLVDEGKIAWDDPVRKHLPAFQMYDPYVSHEMTIRDLLTHRSGLPLGAGDLMIFPASDFTREEILQRVRFLRPSSSFRSKYDYDNLMYIVAGQIIPAITAKSWDAFVRERIFDPLGMTATNTSIRAFRPGDEVAMPHARADGKLVATAPDSLDNAAAAGAIHSSVAEMSKWMIVQLNAGESGGKRLFSAARSREMWSAVTPLPIAAAGPETPKELAAIAPNFAAYGLGWGLQDYRGRKIASHTGGLLGMVSKVTLVPELKLGVVVLTNQESGGAFNAISYTVLDEYLGAAPVDWVSLLAEREKKRRADDAAQTASAMARRNANSRPSLPLESYGIKLRDEWYGDVFLEYAGGKLTMRFPRSPRLLGDLEHFQYDTFIVRWRDRTLFADAYVTFVLRPDGAIDEVKMQAVSPLTDFSFDFHDLRLRPAR